MPKDTKRHTYNAPAKKFYTERWNEPNSKPNLTKRRTRVDLESKPDTHGRQLDYYRNLEFDFRVRSECSVY
jgi:hypothetical protein